MKNTKDKRSEAAPKEVELIVTPEDYEAGLKRGWTDDDMLITGSVQDEARRVSQASSGTKTRGKEAGLIASGLAERP